MLQFLINPLNWWKQDCFNAAVEEVVNRAQVGLYTHFPDDSATKIYFFVLENKKILWETEAYIQKTTAGPGFKANKEIWGKEIEDLPVSLGSYVSFFIQSVPAKPSDPEKLWHAPAVEVIRYHFGCSPLGYAQTIGGGFWKIDESEQIKTSIRGNLASRGVSEERILEIIQDIQ